MNNNDLINKNTVYASGFFYYINKSHDSYLYTFMKKYNLKGNEYLFLLYLHEFNGSTQKNIVSDTRISKPQVSRSLKTLEEKGLIIKKQDDKNRKYTRIYITQKAENILEELVQAEKNWSQMIYDSLTGDAESSRKLLHKLAVDSIDFLDKNRMD